MNAIAKYDPETERAIRTALQTSLYPGASNDSVSMVLAYCQASGLDPLTKPVHIVPMWVKGANGQGSMRDVVMPGIELYRTKAHRTGEYAGQDEAEFGPTVNQTLGGVNCRFPEWAKVTVYRKTSAGRVPFSARVYWLESYATAKRDTDAPNSMWLKRPWGQLEKCAEALALRKAFPEAVGGQATAEEMEGKYIDGHATEVKPAADLMPKAKAAPATEPAPQHAAEAVDGEAAEDDQQQDKGTGLSQLAEGQRKVVLASAARAGLNEAELLQRFPSITPANITATLKSLRELAEKAES